MLRSSSLLALTLALPLSLTACGSAVDDGAEDEPLADTLGGKFDSLKNPTEHGRLFLGQTVRQRLESGHRYHQWIFHLEEPASMTIDLNKVGARAVDTVLYVYKDNEDGTWSLVDKADDDGGDRMAGMWIDLDVGAYQIVAKGKKTTTRGEFDIELTCFGEGCPTKQCLFGPESFADQYGTLVGFEDALVRTDWEHVLTAESRIDIDIVKRQVIAAVNVSAAEVSTVAEALEWVDGGEINHTQLYDTMSGKTYYAFEYGAGDNSYGGIFESGKYALAAKIEDGSITNCRAFHVVPR